MRNRLALSVFCVGEQGACRTHGIGYIVKSPGGEFLHLKLML